MTNGLDKDWDAVAESLRTVAAELVRLADVIDNDRYRRKIVKDTAELPIEEREFWKLDDEDK